MQQTSRATSPLTRERLVDEALQIVDAEGFAGLSLRAVARRLEVTPMALYRYVDSSSSLADLVVSRIVTDRTAETEWPDDPRAALDVLARTVVDLIREHPVLMEAYQRGGVMTPPAMHAVDRVLAALHDGGLSADAAMDAYVAVHCYALGFAAIAMDPTDTSDRSRPDRTEYPALAKHYDVWLTMRSNDRFLSGLALILRAALPSSREPRRR